MIQLDAKYHLGGVNPIPPVLKSNEEKLMEYNLSGINEVTNKPLFLSETDFSTTLITCVDNGHKGNQGTIH